LAVACSRAFLSNLHKSGRWSAQIIDIRPDVSELLTAAAAMSGCPVSLVALDIPLALSPIVGRRVCDDEISRAYGGRKCGTHSPTALRPAAISDRLRDDFARQGYPLLTRVPASRGIIEVYPHPALIELSGAAERLPYKSRSRGATGRARASERRRLLLAQWGEIVSLLDREVGGCAAELLSPNQDATSGVEGL
jgi:predicted RNase H-like nuclease